MRKKYISNFTPLRGLIALLVFAYHLFCVSNKYYNWEVVYSFFDIVRNGLYLFFVISGFVVTNSFITRNYKIKNFFNFIAKRLLRLHPTYLFVLAVGILYIVSRNIYIGEPDLTSGINGFQILAHVFYVVNLTDYAWLNIVFWTLSLEFQFYILYGLLFPLILKYRWILILLMIPSLFLPPLHSSVTGFAPIFAIGIFLSIYYNKKISLIEFLIYVIIASIFVIYSNGFLVFLFTLIIYPCVFIDFKFKATPLVMIGKISYSFFLIHTVTAFAVINIAHRFPDTPINKVGFTLLAIAISIFAAYVVFKYVEQPSAKASHKISYK